MINFKKQKEIKKHIQEISIKLSQMESKSDFSLNNMKNNKVLFGNFLSKFNSERKDIKSIHDVEFQVFSQWGDDGIIQYLVHTLDFENKSFIEFGVENYLESNTRFLLINNCWTGLVIDGSQENIDFIKKDTISWSNQLFSMSAFITKENINSLFKNLPFDKEIGILSIDIDGNDYWVWDSINCINPVVVIVEYNSLFGRYNHWTIPYKENFVRGDIYSSEISFYGASLQALNKLANSKGYSLIGCNKNGNNAYFIRNDQIEKVKNLVTTPEDAFVLCSFNEIFQDNERVLGTERIKKINGNTVFNTEKNIFELIDFDTNEILKHHY